MDFKISVIIPLYNAERYLKNTIESVVSQTIGFPYIQLLICDDHSTDSSLGIALDYAKKYNNIKILQTENNSGSASAPRNVCLQHAEAPFIMFLDNDDVLPPNACKCLYEHIEDTGYDFVCGCYDELHYDKKHRASSRYDSVPPREFSFPGDASDFRVLADPFWTKIFRTQIIKDNSLEFDLDVYGEDTIFMLKYLVNSARALHIKDVVYTYRIREDSLFHVMDTGHFKGVIKGDQKIREVLLDSGYDRYWKEFITDHVSDFLDVIANSEISEDEVREIIGLWYEEIKEASLSGMPAKTPFGEIIFRDAVKGDLGSVTEDAVSLHKICSQKNAFTKDLMNSKSWKLITKINQMLGK